MSRTAHAIWVGSQDSVKSNIICPTVQYSAGEEYKPIAGHVNLISFRIQFTSRTQILSSTGRDKRIGTSHVSSTSTLVDHERCGPKNEWYNFPQPGFCRRVGKYKGLRVRAKLCRNVIIQCMSLEPSDCHALDPIDRVQRKSRTTCVGWLARFKGTDAIHAV